MNAEMKELLLTESKLEGIRLAKKVIRHKNLSTYLIIRSNYFEVLEGKIRVEVFNRGHRNDFVSETILFSNEELQAFLTTFQTICNKKVDIYYKLCSVYLKDGNIKYEQEIPTSHCGGGLPFNKQEKVIYEEYLEYDRGFVDDKNIEKILMYKDFFYIPTATLAILQTMKQSLV